MWWKKKEPKKEEQVEAKKEESLLKELCGDDVKLYSFLSNYMLLDPLTAISQKGLDILTEEGEKSGDFRPAIDKAIFEAAQNPEERERYTKAIQNLASKTIHATEQEKEKAEKNGLTDRADSLGRRIEDQKFMIERTEDIINMASKFYNEELLELGEAERKAARGKERQEIEAEEFRLGQRERAEREARKEKIKEMGKEERREAERQEERAELAAGERKEARAEERRKTEIEESRIEEVEKAEREKRKEDRGQNKR
jgi:hypothetical protein